MKKFFTSLVFMLAFGMYGLSQYFNSGSTIAYTAPTQKTTPISTPAPTAAPTLVASNPTSTPVPQPSGQYSDGTYTGTAVDAYYGTVQVQAIVSGGKLTDVAFLQYPNDRSTSRSINSRAMSLLKSEAIQAQSAQVSAVSGASDTSAAFSESLTSALAQAKS